MRYRPSLDEFMELSRTASLVPVYRQLIGDTLTPVTAFCKIQEGDWSFLFESVIGGERLGRYSFLGSGSFLPFQASPHHVQIQTDGSKKEGGTPGRSAHTPSSQEMDHPDPLRLLE